MALLNYEIEKALASYLSAVLPVGTMVLPGRNPGDKTLNCVICEADGDEQQEDPKSSGNFWVDGVVAIKGSAATDTDGVDPTPADVLLAGLVRAALQVADLAGQLNGQGRILTVLPNGV